MSTGSNHIHDFIQSTQENSPNPEASRAELTAAVTAVFGPAPTRTISVRDVEPGMVLVGEFGGRTYVTGEVGPSSSMPGCFLVEVEHGPLYLHPDLTIEVLAAD